MSRLEEALKRVGRSDRRDDGVASNLSRERNRAVVLEDYPVEEPAAPAAAERRSRRTFGPTLAKPAEPASVVTPVGSPAAITSLALNDDGKLVVGRATPSVSIEQYRRLAATLYQAQLENGLKKVMVSSTLPGEGKTLTVTNLALTLSESYGHRVLLVDADLRSPSIHEVLQIPRGPGLGDYLSSAVSQLPTVQVSANLTIVPAGASEHPIAALVSDRMKLLIEQAASRFDWVLLDTPPVGLLSDANLLASAADAVVFVVGASSSSFHLVQRAITTVGAERIIGIVLNRAAAETLPKSSYYQHYGSQ